jgi:hypothetical protein
MATNTPFDSCFFWLIHEAMLRPDLSPTPEGKFVRLPKTLQKGQLIALEGILRYREVDDDVNGTMFKHRIAEIHAVSIKGLSKVDAGEDPSDGADEE